VPDQTVSIRSIAPSTPWAEAIPYVLDRDSVRAVDKAAAEEFGIPGIVLMENAARALCREAIDMLADRSSTERRALIVCGSGNNGGDGWALARHLFNAAIEVTVCPLNDPKVDSDAGINCAICRRIGVDEISLGELRSKPLSWGLIVDGIFGTGLTRRPERESADAIGWINGNGTSVLAVDVPSGLDCDSGEPLGPAVRATRTVSFVGLKPGFLTSGAQEYLGEVVIADIGAPRVLTERFGTKVPSGR
jgi:NAD(P)H-hydrate epimerase